MKLLRKTKKIVFLVTEKEILDVEKELDLKFPKELIRFI